LVSTKTKKLYPLWIEPDTITGKRGENAAGFGNIRDVKQFFRRTEIMQDFTRGALWGILPSILFFLVAFFCFKKHFPLPVVLASSFGVWLGGALVHQWVLK